MKVLFIHNAMPEYRIAFFQKLSKIVQLDILLTEKELAAKIYNLESGIPGDLNVKCCANTNEIEQIISVGNYDYVILPPIDNLRQVGFALNAVRGCARNKVKLAYWTEKWEPEATLQPLRKRFKNWIQARLITFFASKSDACIAAGKKQKEYFLKNGVAESKIFMAIDSSTSPINNEVFDIREKYGIRTDAKIILFFGRLIKRKGCDILIDACSLLCKSSVHLHLLICGEGEEEGQLKQQVESLKLTNVTFAGKIQPSQRSLYYLQSDVFVLPSYTYKGVIEAWGLTVNESLEQGTPVVSTSAVGAAHEIADGYCCLMVDENDAGAMANGIMEVLGNSDAVNMRERCMDLYEKYSVDLMAQQFVLALK